MQKIWDNFYRYIEQMDACDTLAAVDAVCQQYFQILNIKYFHYSWQPSKIVRATDEIILGDFDSKWVEHANRYDVGKTENSPFMQSPVEWILDEDQIPKNRRNMVTGGVIIPIRGIANSQARLSIFYRKTTYVHNKMLPLLENWAIHMHNQIEKIHADDYVQSPLTQKERDILNLAVVGKTASEIAFIVGVEVTTVNFHLANLRKKFDVYSKAHLIAKALTLNFDCNLSSAKCLNQQSI